MERANYHFFPLSKRKSSKRTNAVRRQCKLKVKGIKNNINIIINQVETRNKRKKKEEADRTRVVDNLIYFNFYLC